jgi:hypothetical protein
MKVVFYSSVQFQPSSPTTLTIEIPDPRIDKGLMCDDTRTDGLEDLSQHLHQVPSTYIKIRPEDSIEVSCLLRKSS